MAIRVGRRQFIAALGSAAAAWPLAARAQQAELPAVGFFHGSFPGPFAFEVTAFLQGLKETGFVEGQNISVEYRWAEGQSDRLPALAADLVRRQVKVIAALGGDATALAAKATGSGIPIVFSNGADPIKNGLVGSLNHPGGTITGVSLFAGTVEAKRLELLHNLVPEATTIAVFNNAFVAETEARSKVLADAAKDLGLKLVVFNLGKDDDFETAFADIAAQKIGALFVSGNPFFLNRRDKVVAMAASQKIPACYAWREMAEGGGLMSYGTDIAEMVRQAGIYTGRIIKSEKPADLPVLQPTKFELILNLKTAKAIGRSVPPTLLAVADEVIE